MFINFNLFLLKKGEDTRFHAIILCLVFGEEERDTEEESHRRESSGEIQSFTECGKVPRKLQGTRLNN